MVDPILGLGLLPHRARICAGLARRGYVRSEYFELDLVGVPDAERVCLFAWPEPLVWPATIALDVVRVGGVLLETAVTVTMEVGGVGGGGDGDGGRRPKPDLGAGIGVCTRAPGGGGGWVGRGWEKVEPALVREIRTLDRTGRPVFQLVDTSVYSQRLTCSCGRVRYSKTNSLHQITACRVCTRMRQLRKRALNQYRTRHRAATMSTEVADRLAQEGLEIGERFAARVRGMRGR